MIKVPQTKKLLKYCEFEETTRKLRVEDCDINEQSITPLVYSLYTLGTRICGLSLSYNANFNDECLKQLIEVLPEMKLLRSLELSKVNVTDQAWMKLFDASQ